MGWKNLLQDEEIERWRYGKEGRVTSISKSGGSPLDLKGLITPGIFLFLGYLLLGNLVLFSKQTMILVIIVAGIWFLLKR